MELVARCIPLSTNSAEEVDVDAIHPATSPDDSQHRLGRTSMKPKQAVSRDFVVYVAVDPGDAVIYVGHSISMAVRWNNHRSKAPWWPEWSMIHIIRVTDIETARDYEKALIQEHQPFFNKLLNPGFRKQINSAPRQLMLEPSYRTH